MSIASEILKSATNPYFQITEAAHAVIKSLETFLDTGKVEKTLFKGFDQNGAWIGIWDSECIEPYTQKISKHVLDKEKVTETDKEGNMHLLTNLVCKEQADQINIEYKSIGGSITAPHTNKVYAHNLTTVYGKMVLSNCETCLLPKLESVGGFIDLDNVKELNCYNLKEIGGALHIYHAKELYAPKLQKVEMIDFRNCPIPNRSKILRSLSLQSLNCFKTKIYDLGTIDLINKELTRKKIQEKIQGIKEKDCLDL